MAIQELSGLGATQYLPNASWIIGMANGYDQPRVALIDAIVWHGFCLLTLVVSTLDGGGEVGDGVLYAVPRHAAEDGFEVGAELLVPAHQGAWA
jgi:hypothetical protein